MQIGGDHQLEVSATKVIRPCQNVENRKRHFLLSVPDAAGYVEIGKKLVERDEVVSAFGIGTRYSLPAAALKSLMEFRRAQSTLKVAVEIRFGNTASKHCSLNGAR
jgi:hypothetical protein